MSDTPRTDKCEKGHSFAGDAYNAVLTLARQLERELRAARAELSELQELTRMQMAGISVAALMNSRQSDPPLHKEHPYWTPAYQDTLDAVIREMAHREESERLLAELEACRADAQRYRWLRSQHEGRTEFGELDADGFPLPSEPIALAFTVFYPQEESLEPVKCDPGSLDAAIDAAREG